MHINKFKLTIRDITPQQHFLSAEKLRQVRQSFQDYPSPGTIYVIKYRNRYFSIDGHHRLYHLFLEGVDQVEVTHDPKDDDHVLYQRLADEALALNLATIGDLRHRIIEDHQEFLEAWVGKCQRYLKEIEEDEEGNTSKG